MVECGEMQIDHIVYTYREASYEHNNSKFCCPSIIHVRILAPTIPTPLYNLLVVPTKLNNVLAIVTLSMIPLQSAVHVSLHVGLCPQGSILCIELHAHTHCNFVQNFLLRCLIYTFFFIIALCSRALQVLSFVATSCSTTLLAHFSATIT